MRAVPYFLVMAILVGGIFVAFQTFSGEAEESDVVAERPTVTPRPRPTSPPRPPSPTFAADPFQSLGANEASMASGLQLPAQPGPTQPAGSSPSPSPTNPAPTATTTQSAMPTAVGNAPSPSPTAQVSLKVGNTGGEGVYLRQSPRMDDKLRPWPDNTPMVVIGPRVEGDGHMWEKVRAPDGSEGYIPAEFLIGEP